MMVRRRGGASHDGQAWDSLLFLASYICLSVSHSHSFEAPAEVISVRSPFCLCVFSNNRSHDIVSILRMLWSKSSSTHRE